MTTHDTRPFVDDDDIEATLPVPTAQTSPPLPYEEVPSKFRSDRGHFLLPESMRSSSSSVDRYFYHFIFMPRAIFIWCGVQPPMMENLAIALVSPIDSAPIQTRLFGDDDAGGAISRRLTQRFNRMIILSIDFGGADSGDGDDGDTNRAMREVWLEKTMTARLQQCKEQGMIDDAMATQTSKTT